jgi:transcriptional regulator with XRE-family HTH domain
MTAGERLKEWRGQRTQAEAAKLLGISQAALSDYESDRKTPDVVRARRIRDLTGGAVPFSSWPELHPAKPAA